MPGLAWLLNSTVYSVSLKSYSTFVFALGYFFISPDRLKTVFRCYSEKYIRMYVE